MLGGLGVWAAHFFTLYALGSIFESSAPARFGSLVATVAAVVANLTILCTLRRPSGTAEDSLAHWMKSLGTLGAMLSLVAVLWQGLPAAVR
jgi:NO-binding membrane sensor protein with MHYT domain